MGEFFAGPGRLIGARNWINGRAEIFPERSRRAGKAADFRGCFPPLPSRERGPRREVDALGERPTGGWVGQLDGWRAAWINDLQRGGLESGVFAGSPGRHLVDRALARLAEGPGSLAGISGIYFDLQGALSC
jgi:hypothetical protein